MVSVYQRTAFQRSGSASTRSDLSRGKDKRGTGLGLSIVKEIVQAHGENINAISTEGVGTEFIFTLPLSKKKGEAQLII